MDFNLAEEYRFGEQLIHIALDIPYQKCVMIAEALVSALIKVDDESGIIIHDVVDEEPLLYMAFIQNFTDADLEGYKDENGDIDPFAVYDDAYEVILPDKYRHTFFTVLYEREKEYKQITSLNGRIGALINALQKIEGGKELGIIRSLLTGIAKTKQNNGDAQETVTEEMPIDLSMYRVKKD